MIFDGKPLSLIEDNEISDLVIKKIRETKHLELLNDKPYFSISVAPIELKRNLIDVDSQSIHNLIINPPYKRDGGWTTQNIFAKIEKSMIGILFGALDYRLLILLENGYMEFITPLDEYFCYGQTTEEFKRNPRIHPYPLIEYPISFLRLYRAIIDHVGLSNNFILKLQYYNLAGYTLAPYGPGIAGFEIHPRLELYNKKNLFLSPLTLESNFLPDKKIFEAMQDFYNAFGFEKEVIPLYNKVEEKFDFPQYSF